MLLVLIELIVILFILYLLGQFIVLPKIRMLYYKNQNIKEFYFYPFYGWFKDSILQLTNEKRDCLASIKQISQNPEFKDQDIILSNSNSQAFLLLINPDLIKEFLQNQQNYIKYEIPFHGLNKLIGTGLAKRYGDGWKKNRKILSNMFTFEQIAIQFNCMKEISQRYLQQQHESAFNVSTTFENITASSDIQILLGTDIEKCKDKSGQNLGNLIQSFTNDIYLRDIGIFSLIFGQTLCDLNLRKSDRILSERGQQLRQFMLEIILECKKREKSINYQPKYPSFISHIVKEGLLNTEEEINDFLSISFNLFLSAKEITGKLATQLLYHLIKYPKQYEKVFNEIQTYAPNDDYTFADLQKLNILQSNMKECLRMGTTGPFLFQRQVIKDHTLGKYNIKKGTLINLGFLANFYNDKYFDDPFTYKPERWEDQQQEQEMRNNNFIFIPFSGGSRNCLGQHLAIMQVKTIIVEFIKRFKLPEYPRGFDDEKFMEISYGFKHDFILTVENRKT